MQALYSLGMFYRNGDVIGQEYQKAFELFKKAAKKGYAAARLEFGVCYETNSSRIRFNMALNYQGCENAIYRLGYCYKSGNVVRRKDRKATRLLYKSCSIRACCPTSIGRNRKQRTANGDIAYSCIMLLLWRGCREE